MKRPLFPLLEKTAYVLCSGRRRRYNQGPPHLEALEMRCVPSACSGLGVGVPLIVPADSTTQTQAAEAYGQLPLSFEANQGQTGSQVRFLSRGAGYALFLTPSEAVLSLQKPGTAIDGVSSSALSPNLTEVALAMNLVGANEEATVMGLDQQPGVSNYFLGNDPSQWHTNVINYARVDYQDIYPGVNLVYHGNQGQLEYDFVVAPGTDADIIRLTFDGASNISLDAQGDLVLQTVSGDVIQRAPVAYQDVDGIRDLVTGNFVILGPDQVGFRVGTYNPSLPLTIDPVLIYSTYLGGNLDDNCYGIAVDGAGDAYVTGSTQSTNLPTTMGAYQTSHSSDHISNDVFVAKLNPGGTGLIYCTYLGGNGDDGGTGIALDSSGNAYVTGYTQSTDFPITMGACQSFNQGGQNSQDAFVTKLNSTGTGLVYSTYLGGTGDETSTGIALDMSGAAYVAGVTFSRDFPITPNAYQTSHAAVDAGNFDAFFSKLNATGSALDYSTYLGGSTADEANGIAIDAIGNAYIVGDTYSTDFPTTAGAFQGSHASTFGKDAFIAKINPNQIGSASLVFSTYLGGSGLDVGDAIAVDSSGYSYVTGWTASSDFPTTPSAFQTSYPSDGGNYDAFIAKLSPGGTGLIYCTFLGGNDAGLAIAVDSTGNAYITGKTQSTSFPVTPDAYQSTQGSNGGTTDAFVTKLNTTGTAPLYSTFLGGTGLENGTGIALDGAGNFYVAGLTGSTDFSTTTGAFQTGSSGLVDGFVAKFAQPSRNSITMVASSASPSVSNQNVTFTATVAPGLGFGTATGTVQFVVDGVNFGPPKTLVGGSANISVAILSVGAHTVAANYSGDTSFLPSSGMLTGGQIVNGLSQFLVEPEIVGSTVVAGSPVLMKVQAADQLGNPITAYSGPGSVTVTSSPSSSGFPLTVTLDSTGLGYTLATLTKLGTYTLSASSGGYGTINPSVLTVLPGVAAKLGFAEQPGNSATGDKLGTVTVQVQDQFGNLVSVDNTDSVTLAVASGPGGILAGSTTVTPVINGIATFNNLTLVVPGTYTLGAIVPARYIGPNSSSFTIAPLQVLPGSFAGSPSGFSVSFTAPFLVNATTPVQFGQGFGSAAPMPTVTLVGPSGPVDGSVVLNPASNSLTFIETDTAQVYGGINPNGQPQLPDGAYAVTIHGTAAGDGLQALNAGGGFLDGTGAGTPGHDFTTTFTVNTAASGPDVLWIPATADGPKQTLQAPGNNVAGGGYPVYLNDTTGTVTSVSFTFNYNPAMLTLDATPVSSNPKIPGSSITLNSALSSAGHAVLTYTGTAADAADLTGGNVPLGFINAHVVDSPSSAPIYKGKDLLTLGSIQINGGAVSVVGVGALHLVAFVGDADGNGIYSSNDAVLITRVGLQTDAGFVAYPLVDPVIVADTDASGFIPPDAGLQVNEVGVGFPATTVPPPPTGANTSPIGNTISSTLRPPSRPQLATLAPAPQAPAPPARSAAQLAATGSVSIAQYGFRFEAASSPLFTILERVDSTHGAGVSLPVPLSRSFPGMTDNAVVQILEREIEFLFEGNGQAAADARAALRQCALAELPENVLDQLWSVLAEETFQA